MATAKAAAAEKAAEESAKAAKAEEAVAAKAKAAAAAAAKAAEEAAAVAAEADLAFAVPDGTDPRSSAEWRAARRAQRAAEEYLRAAEETRAEEQKLKRLLDAAREVERQLALMANQAQAEVGEARPAAPSDD